MLTSSTSYLVPPFPVMASDPIIAPQREEPEAFSKPDWDSLLDSNIAHLGEEDLIQKVKDLQAGLMLARDGLQAREVVIESKCDTGADLPAPKDRPALKKISEIREKR